MTASPMLILREAVVIRNGSPGVGVRLDGWPMRTPVNASPRPSRATAHDSGTMWLAIPSSWWTFTSYFLPV